MKHIKIINLIDALLDGREAVVPDLTIVEKHGDAFFVYEGCAIWRNPICGVYPNSRSVLISVYGKLYLKPCADFSYWDEFAHRLDAHVIPATRIDALVNPRFAREGLDEFIECYVSHLEGLAAWLEARGGANAADVEDFLRVAKIRDTAWRYTTAVLGEKTWKSVEEWFRAEAILGEKAKNTLAAIGEAAGF